MYKQSAIALEWTKFRMWLFLNRKVEKTSLRRTSIQFNPKWSYTAELFETLRSDETRLQQSLRINSRKD